MADPIFRKLQEQLDQYSVGFPATESGIEIKILEKLFTLPEAEIFSQLTPMLETPEDIAPRIGMNADDAAKKLADMAEKGLVFSLNKNGIIRYGAIAFVHGLFEFQVTRLDREFAELCQHYIDNEFKEALAFSAAGFLRVIPIQKSIDVRNRVAPYEDAAEILKGVKKIVVTDCVCRKSAGLLDKSCNKILEVCFMFGSMAQYYLDHDMGREVGVEEALQILEKAHEAGLVTQPATSQNPTGMCNCCGDCCGPLSSIKSHPKPAEMVFSNYFAVVDDAECTGCETCVERCEFEAIQINDSDIAEIDLDRCIGCGLCVTTCPTDAINLEVKAADNQQVPPQTTLEQMLSMVKKRGVI